MVAGCCWARRRGTTGGLRGRRGGKESSRQEQGRLVDQNYDNDKDGCVWEEHKIFMGKGGVRGDSTSFHPERDL